MHGVEMGVDLRGVPVIAFGGAGPVHACGVAELLEADRVIFPVNASVLSAFGTLVSPVRIDLARSMVRRLGDVDVNEREALLDELRSEGKRILAAAGVPEEAIVFRYGVDARYAGQGNEITVWLGEGLVWPATDDAIAVDFEREYQRIYGMAIPDVGIEIVTWRLAVTAAAAPFEPGSSAETASSADPKGYRPMRFARGAEAVTAPVYRRDSLGVGAVIDGPAVIEERETTSVIRPGWRAIVAKDGSVIAERLVPTEGES